MLNFETTCGKKSYTTLAKTYSGKVIKAFFNSKGLLYSTQKTVLG